jgi:hypothetical protein
MLSNRIDAFIELGNRLRNLDAETLDRWIRMAKNQNGWFDEDSVRQAIEGVAFYLSAEQLHAWTARYQWKEPVFAKKVGLVMAGNIPLVGFHDVVCILLSGHIAMTKLSSQDSFLPKEVASILFEIDPMLQEFWLFADRMNEVDALIATGSDNTAKHFEYYFRKKPHIIRRNRNAIAVLTGQETEAELQALSRDVLSFYGLGCRNVSKLFVPEGYDFSPFLLAATPLSLNAINNHKYSNNYDYNKSIYLVNLVPHLDNGGLMLTESEAIISPISVVYTKYYKNIAEVEAFANEQREKLQCIVSKEGLFPNSVPFGKAQYPSAWDYADGVDTLQFLLGL